MVAVRDFSGLTRCACALANAEARAANVSLDRCMGGLRIQDIKAHGARLRAFGSHAMPHGFLGVFRHQGLELALGPLMVEKGLPGVAEQRCELRPRVRRTHVDAANGLDAWTRRLSQDEVGDFA